MKSRTRSSIVSVMTVLCLLFSFISQNAIASSLNDEPLKADDKDFEPENYFNITGIQEMVNKLAGMSVSYYVNDTRDCYKLGVKTGIGGEERKMDGSITSVGYRSGEARGDITVAIFRVFVAGKSWQKGFKCIHHEYNMRHEDFRGTALLKLKRAPGGIAVLKIEVDNDHWGMMKEALRTALNQAGFIVKDDV